MRSGGEGLRLEGFRRLGEVRRALLACLAGACVAVVGCQRRPVTFPHAPVILISIDTLRADHLPAYGYRDVQTPNLDALRRDSVLFENALAQVPLTLPSHATILTGLLPFQHGVRDNQGYRLAKDHQTLASFLKAKGYATGAAVSAFALSHTTGIAEGFDFYEDGVESRRAGEALGQVQRSGFATEALLERWLESESESDGRGDRPFFAFLHLYEPHSPYDPPEPFRSQYSARPYDGEIAAADAIVGRLLDRLKARRLYERALVVLLSDHGEGLGDHGEEEHGIFVYREALRVPLLLKLPGQTRAGERVASPVGLMDVYPTIVSLLGERPGGPLPGVPLVGSAPVPAKRRIYAESLYPRLHLGWSDLASLTDERHQYIHSPSPELYDWVGDPGEKQDLAAGLPPAFRALRVELQSMNRPMQAPGTADAETVRKLTALGYIGTTLSGSDLLSDLPSPRERIRVLDRLKAGSRLATENREEEAVAALRALAQENPKMLEVWETLAAILRRAGRTAEAIDALQQADRQQPGTPQILLGLAELEIENRDFAKARSLVKSAGLLGARDVHEELAAIALEEGDLPTARAEIESVLTGANQTVRRPWLLRSRIRAKQGDLAGALADVQRALEIEKKWDEPPMVDLQATRGDVLARLGKEGEAEQAFRLEIGAFPENLSAWSRLALLYASSGRIPEFRKLLEQMTTQLPTRKSFETAVRISELVGDRPGAGEWKRRLMRRFQGAG